MTVSKHGLERKTSAWFAKRGFLKERFYTHTLVIGLGVYIKNKESWCCMYKEGRGVQFCVNATGYGMRSFCISELLFLLKVRTGDDHFGEK